ncbi:MAG TPA: hypothetical protein PLT09_08795 [Deltaproteobacteria bacterium]|nr:hypothetical protein [Deltaproteobacteria bacterium]
MTGRLNLVISWKYAASLVLVLAASLALLLPLTLFTPPRDSEVWLFQSISEMQEQQQHLPLLNGEILKGGNPLTLAALSLIPVRDITTPRLASCALGCIFIAFIFLYTLSLFDLKSALASSAVMLTSFGYLALFGTLNLIALPVTLAAAAFGIFSLTYLGRLRGTWYIASYVLAASAAVTGGYLMLLFFVTAALLLILFDLAPSQFFSIHLMPGAAIIVCAFLAYFSAYRILAGPGFTDGSLSSGDHLGFFHGLFACLTYGAPWIFLLAPALLYGGGPSDQETWRRLLPLRTACSVVFLILWVSSRSMPQHAVLLTAFAAPLIGDWMAHGMRQGLQKKALGAWMMALSGITVFAAALVILSLPMVRGSVLHLEQIIAVAVFAVAALAFVILVLKRTLPAQFILAATAAVVIVWCMAFVSPEGQWSEKITYMEGVSDHDPLIVYEDDLTMRGYMSAVTARPVVVGRDAVPMNDTAFLAVSTSDLSSLLDELKGRMNSVVLDSYRAENTYALMLISPRKRGN